MLRGMTIANVALLSLAASAPAMRAFALPDVASVDQFFWFSSEHQFFDAWGVVFGPVIVAALLVTLLLAYWRRGNRVAFRASVLAALAYMVLLVALLIVSTSDQYMATKDWPSLLQRGQMFHMLAVGLSMIGWLALLRASFRAQRPA